MPPELRRAYLLVLGPPALIAPLPLFWTHGASPLGIALYELALVLLFFRARAGRPVRLSDAVLNAIGLSYFFWLAVETAMLRPGLLRSVSHLLLFTAIAKLASLKRPGEARTALLVIFLLVLGSVSSSTHVASLIYCAVMAVLAFRTLSRLAVLADFQNRHLVRGEFGGNCPSSIWAECNVANAISHRNRIHELHVSAINCDNPD